ncbi:hypothetical protein ONZ45_g16719 [Pleurotus djamor]|nr:hypothetical protein ONZ45_g16719 [Pleurotus djamor]
MNMFRNLTGSGRPSPIGSLPIEILSHIFALSCFGETSERDEHPLGFDTQSITIPLVLSTVCRRWRQVALSTSSLWTTLCVTPDFVLGDSLDTTHITTFLHRSRKVPLRIFVDVRDPDWDFTEPGVTQSPSNYQPPLASEHLSQALSILLPHLSRWCSISIFTDTWALMHTALTLISPAITTLGAPLLESITLMRCNDFVSFGQHFQPRELKDSPLFSFDPTHSTLRRDQVLPMLRDLTLKGVHADWLSLSQLLSPQRNGGLRTLELSSHSRDVRPPFHVFQDILSKSPGLQKLVIRGSGFSEPSSTSSIDTDAPLNRSNDTVDRAYLPELRDLDIGYRCVAEGCRLVDILDAPGLTSITLCDDSHPAEAETLDGASLLSYIGRGTSTSSNCDENIDSQSDKTPSIPFPKVEQLILDKVQSSPSHFRTTFEGLGSVRSLELKGTPLGAMQSLLPSSQCSVACPCPALESLTLFTAEPLSSSCAQSRLHAFLLARTQSNAALLRDASVYLDSHSSFCSREEAIRTTMCGTDVRVFEALPEDDDMLDWMTCVGDDEETAFKLGGAFHDPYFDSYYSGTIDIAAR